MCCCIRQTTTKLILISLYLILLCAQTVTGIITVSPSLPEVNTRATISCYSVQTAQAGITWYHKGLYKATCNNQGCLPDADPQSGYTFTADNDKAQMTISSLNRARDGGLWLCSTAGINQSIYLDVYSFPSGLHFTQGGDTDIDLAESSTILQCQTDRCMYPVPTIRWYFKDITPSALRTLYKDTGTNITGGSCTSPEELYTSRLVLPHYTTWQDNIDKNVTLSCGIEYSDVSRNVYSQESKQIRYAVRVTVAYIQHNNQNITDILNVTAGVPILLTCLTGTSRPPATIVWFIGSQSKGNGASWNYTPSPADHNGILHCQAYNTDPDNTIDSNKARLYVKVRVDSVQLRNGTALALNERQVAVLICETSACRPSAAMYWMKNGINITDSPADVTVITQASGLFISMGTLRYTGKREDNGKSLTCGASNGLDSGLTSGILTVTIYYPPESPPEIKGQVNGSRFTVIEHTSQSLVCSVTGGNPLANLAWICLGLIGISNTSGQTLVSEIILDVNQSAQDQRCTCQSSHPADRSKDVFVLLQVHYPPNIQLQSSPYKLIENQTLNVTCQVNSNPPADQTYWSPSGDGSVSSNLYISSVSRYNKGNYSCTAKNTMMPTVGGQQIGTSIRQIEVDVLYPPSIQVMTNPYVVIENQTLDVDCLASSNPPPDNIFWTPSGEGSVSSRLYFRSVSRDKSGIYICTAHNNMIPTNGEKQNGINTRQIKVDVQYASKITEFVTKGNISETSENSTLEFICQVDSNPYAVISLYLADGLITTMHNASELNHTITAECLSAGKYVCSATNSVLNGRRVSAEINLKVKCIPRLDSRKDIITEYYRSLNDNVTLAVNVIAYPEPTDIRWYHKGAATDIWQPVPNQLESTSGLFASITVHLVSQADFGDYLVNMTNILGSFDHIIHVIPENVVQVPPGLQVTSPGIQVGALVGGVGAGIVVVVICVILVIHFMKRRNMRKREGTPLELNGRSKDINKGEGGLLKNPVYESSGRKYGPSASKGTTVAEYAAVVKSKTKDTLVDDPSKLYAQVDKTNTNKKKGDVYENIDLGGKSTNVDSSYENPRQTGTEAPDGTVYENPGAVTSSRPQINKDGLLYADLMLDPPTTKKGKAVIRGIDNHTEYADIDFGKKGEPSF